MRKTIIIYAIFFVCLHGPLFTQDLQLGLEGGEIFVNERIDGMDFYCAARSKSFLPEKAVEQGATACLMAVNPVDGVIYFIPFAKEDDLIEFVKAYVGITKYAYSLGGALAANGIIPLINDYASKRTRQIVVKGKICCWTVVSYGRKSKQNE